MIKRNSIKKMLAVLLALLNLQSISALSWTSEYTLVDLELTGTDFVNEVTGWTMTSCYPGNSGCVTYYDCGGTYLIGGYQILGGNTGEYFQRIYTGLPGHNQINMTITMYPLDSWDGVTHPDHFEFYFDGTTSLYGWRVTYDTSYAYNQCGNPSYADPPPIQATLTVPHTASTLTFRVVSGLDTDTQDESFGFRDITMNFVNVSSPSSSLCGVVTTGELPDKICPCEASNMYMSPANSGYCHYCDDTCLTCSGSSSTCTSCDDGTYLGSNTCKPCNPYCTTCDGPSASECSSCVSDKFLVDQTCTPYCPEPFYSTLIDGTNVCQTHCTGAFAYKDGTCSPTCDSPYGEFYTVSLKACICYNPGLGDVCYTCDSSCLTCSGQDATQCATCHDRYYVSIIDTTNNTGTCEACDPSCLTCSGPDADQCLTCDPYYYLITDNSVNGTCQPCDGTCLTCNGALANQCVTCADNFYFTPDGSTGVGTCTPCDPSCATCDGSSAQQCLTCPSGSYLINNNTCVTSCNSPFFVTTNGRKDFCETPCTDTWNSSAFESGYCRPNCGTSLYRSATLVTLNACYCDNYEYWNSSCLATCDSPLTNTRTQGTRKFCDYPCTQNQYLFTDGSCLDSCDFPLIWQNISGNNFCISKGCSSMNIKNLKTLTNGFQYRLHFIPDSCDWDPVYLQILLNANEGAKEVLGDFSFTVTKTQAATFILDLTLSQSIFSDTNLVLSLGNLTGDMTVFQKFKPTALAQKLAAMAQSAQAAVTAATGAALVSALVMQGTTSVWGFVGFQQLINYLKYLNVAYPFQMEMLFVLGGGTKFSSAVPNFIDTNTKSQYDTFQADENLVDDQAPPRRFENYDETSNFIKNGGSLLLMNVIFLVVVTLVAQLRRIRILRENKIFGLIDVNLRWNFLLRTLLTTSTPLAVTIFLQLRTTAFEGEYLTISSALAIASGVYFVGMCIAIVRILHTLNPEDFKKKECQDVYGTLVKGLDVQTHHAKYYYLFVLVRGVVIAAAIVFAQSEPLLQIVLLFVTNFSLVIYMFRQVTFANAKETRKTLITEFLITVTEVLIALLLAKKKSEQYYNTLGWVIVGVVGLMFINELLFIISMQVTAVGALINTIRDKLKKKPAPAKVEERVNTNTSVVKLAIVSPPDTPKMTNEDSSISSDRPDLFQELDQPSPANIAQRRFSHNISPFARRSTFSKSPLISQKQTFSSLALISNTDDKPPLLIEDIKIKDNEEFDAFNEKDIPKLNIRFES